MLKILTLVHVYAIVATMQACIASFKSQVLHFLVVSLQVITTTVDPAAGVDILKILTLVQVVLFLLLQVLYLHHFRNTNKFNH